MKGIFLFVALCLLASSCTGTAGSSLKYGYLPGSDYQYYEPLARVDLGGKRYRPVIKDDRLHDRISCWQFSIPRDTDLEGVEGLEYFSGYLRAMIEANNGVVDLNSGDVLEIELRVLSAEVRGAGFARVYGLAEFHASIGDLKQTYCSAMADGDKDAPVGKLSLDTRTGAVRKMVSASTRRVLEELMHDLAAPSGDRKPWQRKL